MNGVVVVVGVVLGATIGLFLVWYCVMNRIDEREQRRYAEEAGHADSAPGGARHLRSGSRGR